ncbi:uncharacterized protein LOC131639602 [Vicia villosa]|uniref:uncharacterized protein LOC131639602 n=1 Tax=Vicia villosa TaxID=3911 RepID=UPI00273C580E|nr:uncharacterized protein LOC131639602 [Vicia villosa]
MVVGRNDDAIVDALRMLARSLGEIPQANAGNRNGDDDEYRALGKFQRNNSPTYEGEHEPDNAQAWLKAIEKIFRVIAPMLRECSLVTWDRFRDAFFENYFPEDYRGKKEVEFLELKQGNGIVAVYAARFQELIKYCPHYNTMNAERSKCLKFVNGLRRDIKKAIGYQQITRFTELVNKSRIYDEDIRESASHYKAMNEKKFQFRGKLYDGKGKQKACNGKKPSGGGSHTLVKCYRYGVEGHRISECPQSDATCFKCGKLDDVQVRDNLTIDTSPIRIEDREVNKLCGKKISLVKVIWGGVADDNITWELEDKMKESYLELFA